ncbi:MAG: DUF3047 domain-containing protein [Bacteroidia bacterium]|nr:DUF3047 domain-containing protein [Bacteroidia bacterium]
MPFYHQIKAEGGMLLKRITVKFFLIFSILLSTVDAYAVRLPKIFSFKEKNALSEWQEKVFRGRVLYSVKADRGAQYLRAYSDDSASGIFYEIKFNPKQYPMISWQWTVLRFPSIKESPSAGAKGDNWIEKDDYAARVYVIFPKLSFNLTKCLEYVWDIKLPAGTIITSPYSENIKLFVVESGSGNAGKWISVERNIAEDYKKAFGKEPGRVGAIAIMTDTDNTQSTAEANYRELKVGYKNEK